MRFASSLWLLFTIFKFKIRQVAWPDPAPPKIVKIKKPEHPAGNFKQMT